MDSEKNKETMELKKVINVIPLVFGMPAIHLFIMISISYLVSTIIPVDFLFLVITSLIMALLIRYFFYGDYLSLAWERNSPFPVQKILIRGISSQDLETVDSLIESNRCVEFYTPSNPLLEQALALYVTERLGEHEIFRSENFEIKSNPYAKKNWLLSMSNREMLQKTMNSLIKRGWKADGEYLQQSSIFNTVHTQRMILE